METHVKRILTKTTRKKPHYDLFSTIFPRLFQLNLQIVKNVEHTLIYF